LPTLSRTSFPLLVLIDILSQAAEDPTLAGVQDSIDRKNAAQLKEVKQVLPLFFKFSGSKWAWRTSTL
jgi:hypothetical protein